MNPYIKYTLYVVTGILILLLVTFLAVYFWPTSNKSLQMGTEKSISYEESLQRISAITADEQTKGVTKECQSTLLTHGSKTAKTVVLFHGITACPGQFSALGKIFFDAGYNVYIPRVPHHGTNDPKNHAKILTQELVDYANTSVTIATGLGTEVGTTGLSGGAVVATWAAQYRPEISRLLVLSPFYEPAVSQVPKWQLPLLKKLYGFHILADVINDDNFSYYALANYLILGDNLKQDPANLNLKNIAVIISASDKVIDPDLAIEIPRNIAGSNDLGLISRTLPAEWNVGHALVDPTEDGVAERQAELFALYLAFYEGPPALN